MGKMSELFTLEQRVSEITDDFFECPEQEQEKRREEYRTILQPALLAVYGEFAPATQVDPWTAEVYSELYKDRNGIRPRGDSYRTMMLWMDNIPPLEDSDHLFADEDEDEDDRFDPDISKWVDEDEIAEMARDFQEVYGVAAMGQAMRFMDMGDY